MTAQPKLPAYDDHRVDTRIASELLVLLVLTCVLLISWAWYGELDIFCTAPGEVIPSGQIKKVQHLEGGIIKSILVKEGDRVELGQALITLESTSSDADVEEISARLASLQVEIARLEAEANLSGKPNFPAHLQTQYPELIRQAGELFDAESNRYHNDQQTQRKLINQRQQEINQIKVRIENSKDSLKLIAEQVTMSEELLKAELTNRYNHLSLLREESTLRSKIEEDEAAIGRAESSLEEAKSILNGLTHSFKEQARQQLANKRREFKELTQRRRKFTDQFQRTVLHAPVNGIIKSLNVFAQGEVIRAGDTVMDIVPEEDHLIIETFLKPGDIGYIQIDQEASLMLASRSSVRYDKLPGTVIGISPDTFTGKDGEPYYKVQIRPSQDYFQGDNWQYQLKAGVQVSASILVGKRRILAYLLEPLMASVSTALSER